MSLLIKNSLPAERARGLVFAENFETSQKVVQNGATIVGAPAIDFGATLDGSADYFSYPAGGLLNSANISFVVEFYPDFDTDADIQALLYDSSSGSRYYAFKNNNAQNNGLFILMGDTSIATIAEETYSPYWNVNARNVLVVTGDATNDLTNVWLNGNQILTDDNTAWALADPAAFYIGAAFNGTALFDGKITKVQIYNSLLTAKEATDFYNNDTFNYRNKAVLDLPMGMAEHDPTNNRSLDVSKNVAHATLGAGDGGATTPTKQVTHGYDFDGSADFMTGTGTGIFNTTEISIVVEFYPDFATDLNAFKSLFDTSNGSRYVVFKRNNAGSNVLELHLGGTVIGTIAEATYSPFWNVNARNVLIVTGDDTNNLTNAWLNGNQIMTDDSSAWANADPAAFFIGSTYVTSSYFGGKITGFQVYPFLLTGTQREDILIGKRHKVNDV